MGSDSMGVIRLAKQAADKLEGLEGVARSSVFTEGSLAVAYVRVATDHGEHEWKLLAGKLSAQAYYALPEKAWGMFVPSVCEGIAVLAERGWQVRLSRFDTGVFLTAYIEIAICSSDAGQAVVALELKEHHYNKNRLEELYYTEGWRPAEILGSPVEVRYSYVVEIDGIHSPVPYRDLLLEYADQVYIQDNRRIYAYGIDVADLSVVSMRLHKMGGIISDVFRNP